MGSTNPLSGRKILYGANFELINRSNFEVRKKRPSSTMDMHIISPDLALRKGNPMPFLFSGQAYVRVAGRPGEVARRTAQLCFATHPSRFQPAPVPPSANLVRTLTSKTNAVVLLSQLITHFPFSHMLLPSHFNMTSCGNSCPPPHPAHLALRHPFTWYFFHGN